MGRYTLRRILEALPVLFVVSILLFVLMNSFGDPLAVLSAQLRGSLPREGLRARGIERVARNPECDRLVALSAAARPASAHPP